MIAGIGETYICKSCGEVFETPLIKKIHYSEWEPDELDEKCPYCLGDNFTLAVKCEMCGEWVAAEDMEPSDIDPLDVCIPCKNKTLKKFENSCFTDLEKSVLWDYFIKKE